MRFKYKYTDYHIHTRWSHDIKEFGPSFEHYARIAEKKKINICFLEHYELFPIENDPTYPFYGGKIEQYLEEVDDVKATYDFVLSGLEIDYYEQREEELHNFMEEYGNQLDFIAGTLHETTIGYPVTTREKLVRLLQQNRIKDVVDNFFRLSKLMIQSELFENICHLDTIFRYINPNDIQPTFDTDVSDERILELGRLCIKKNIRIEYNLSGPKYPIGRTFPSKKVVKKLAKEGAQFFIGSDSHSTNYFKTKIRKIKKATKYINKLEKKYKK